MVVPAKKADNLFEQITSVCQSRFGDTVIVGINLTFRIIEIYVTSAELSTLPDASGTP